MTYQLFDKQQPNNNNNNNNNFGLMQVTNLTDTV